MGFNKSLFHRDFMIDLLDIAKETASNANCNRLSVGALVVDNYTILGKGTNRSIEGHPTCQDVGCLMFEGNCKRTVHAEMSAIFNAVNNGHNLKGKIMVCTHFPCPDCMKYIAASGIRAVYYENPYVHKYENEFSRDLELIHYSSLINESTGG